MSEEEIRTDLEQQRMEKAASAEMEQTSTVIKKTGIFDRVDTLYGDFSTVAGGDAGGMDDFGGGGDFGGAMDSAADSEAGGEATEAEAGAAVESTTNKVDNLLVEQQEKLLEKTKKYRNTYLKRLIESIDNDSKVYNVDGIDDEVDTLNIKIEQMSKEIDNIIDNEEK